MRAIHDATGPSFETEDEARARFWATYLDLGGRELEWFDEHVGPLVRIALHQPPAQPVFDRLEVLPWGRQRVSDEAQVA